MRLKEMTRWHWLYVLVMVGAFSFVAFIIYGLGRVILAPSPTETSQAEIVLSDRDDLAHCADIRTMRWHGNILYWGEDTTWNWVACPHDSLNQESYFQLWTDCMKDSSLYSTEYEVCQVRGHDVRECEYVANTLCCH